MNKDQTKMVDLLLEVQVCMRTTTFVSDQRSYDNMAYYFDRFVDSFRVSLGNQQIKEYLKNE